MIIYQYIPKEKGLEAIKNKSTLLKKPIEFNDPFDCHFYISEREKEKTFKLFVNYCFFKELYDLFFVKRIVPNKCIALANVAKGNIALLAKKLKKTKTYYFQPDVDMYMKLGEMYTGKRIEDFRPLFDAEVEKILKQARKSILVSCFSLDYKSILMWSHYSDKHKGICIEYDINDEENFKNVIYKKKEPCFQLTRIMKIILGHDFIGEEIHSDIDLYGFALKPILAKYTDWKYEKEVRCAFSAKSTDERIWADGDKIFLRMPKPRKVYIGCKADEDYIRDIKKVVGDIPVQRMRIVDGKYAVEEDSL